MGQGRSQFDHIRPECGHVRLQIGGLDAISVAVSFSAAISAARISASSWSASLAKLVDLSAFLRIEQIERLAAPAAHAHG